MVVQKLVLLVVTLPIFLPLVQPNQQCALLVSKSAKPDHSRYKSLQDLQACITYNDINIAYFEALRENPVSTPQKNEEWTTSHTTSLGALLTKISTIIARNFGLKDHQIEHQLPQININQTKIVDICPYKFHNAVCMVTKYRRYDGLCTNSKHPIWGAVDAPFTRLVDSKYGDGISSLRLSVTGRPLPLPRVVTNSLHSDESEIDHTTTSLFMAWGQFINHDMVHAVVPVDPNHNNEFETCCNRPPHLKHPQCSELTIPEDDCFYRKYNVKCLNFVRAFEGVREGCKLGSRVQINDLTATLDASGVYGTSEKLLRWLRTGHGGLLKMFSSFKDRKDLLPVKTESPDQDCVRYHNQSYCFATGERRANIQTYLTCIHTIMAREHNRIATALARINPGWNDEFLFQETRRIVFSEIQHITYNEYLPVLLGRDVMERHGLMLEKNGYWDGYQPTINPGISDAFGAAAFRFGHSLIPKTVERWSKEHKFIASRPVSTTMRRPYELYQPGVVDEYILGFTNQPSQGVDASITHEMRNLLLTKPENPFGGDLISTNIQRGRDFGLAGYLEYRKFCGLRVANSFKELEQFMPAELASRFENLYEDPKDIDLWSGGVAETPAHGSMVGPTFACIMATQFNHTRRGDRFWYELPNRPSSFTPEQLQEIRKVTIARLICDNTDSVEDVQKNAMVLTMFDINPRVSCKDSSLPSMDLKKWKV